MMHVLCRYQGNNVIDLWWVI